MLQDCVRVLKFAMVGVRFSSLKSSVGSPAQAERACRLGWEPRAKSGRGLRENEQRGIVLSRRIDEREMAGRNAGTPSYRIGARLLDRVGIKSVLQEVGESVAVGIGGLAPDRRFQRGVGCDRRSPISSSPRQILIAALAESIREGEKTDGD